MKINIEICYKDTELTVYLDYTPQQPQTQNEPAMPAVIEVDNITFLEADVDGNLQPKEYNDFEQITGEYLETYHADEIANEAAHAARI
jgi:hypothetical protein